MWRQFLTKRYWLRVAGNFLFLLIIYTIVSYFFRENGEPFWNLAAIQKRTVFAFFMSVIFAYRHREQTGFKQEPDSDHVKIKWTVKDFFGAVSLMFFFAVVIMSLLFGIGWLVKSFVSPSDEPVGKIYLNTIAVTCIMCLFSAIILFLSDWIGMRWERRP